MTEFESGLEKFDDLVRCYNVLLRNSCDSEFQKYIQIQESQVSKFIELKRECKRLKLALDQVNKTISVQENQLVSARNLVDLEKHERKKISHERDAYATLLDEICRFIQNVPLENRERLAVISQSIEDLRKGSSNHSDLNSTSELSNGSSEINITHLETDDELHNTSLFLTTKKHSCRREEISSPKRRKSNSALITFYPTAPQAEPPESLESEVESVERSGVIEISVLDKLNTQAHTFISKMRMKSEQCLSCEKSIGFGHKALKCTGCKAVIHLECREKLPLPCMYMGTLSKQGTIGSINDYVGSTSPKIPAIVIHCVNHVEQHGLKEIGIYRTCGMESKVREIKEKFLKCRGVPNLAEQDINVVCGCLKDFLRNLEDSLIPKAVRSQFAKAISEEDKTERLKELISQLPEANLDTLAYLILHLKKVSNSPYCQMNKSNLATIFGPTIVGYTNNDQECAVIDVTVANAVMRELLILSQQFWSEFIVNHSREGSTPFSLHNASPNDNVTKKSRKFLQTPKIKKKFFDTPSDTNKEN